jgi:transposase
MEKKSNPVFNEINRFVAGIDLAWRADHYVCGPRLDNGEFEIKAFGTTTPELYKMLKWLKERKVVSVAIESTSVYWIPTADLLESNGIKVVLVDPRVVRMVPGRKSDIKDCQWLQKLHSCGLLRGAFRPSEEIVAIRSVLREKDNVTAMRTQAIQQMQKSLDQMNIRVHHAVSDITGKTGSLIVQAIIDGERDPHKLAALRDKRCAKNVNEIAEHLTGTWREEHLFNLKQAFMTLQFLDDRIREYETEAFRMFSSLNENDDKTDIEPPDSENNERAIKKVSKKKNKDTDILTKILGFDLTSIPGIGYNTAAVIISELGNKFDSFLSEKHFASYLGLAPTLAKSAGKNVRQKYCKNTSKVGRALRQAASTLHHSKVELGAFYRNVARRTDRKTAVKATARRMAHMIYRGVKYGQEYIERGQEAFDLRMKEKAINKVKKLVNSFNINVIDIIPKQCEVLS